MSQPNTWSGRLRPRLRQPAPRTSNIRTLPSTTPESIGGADADCVTHSLSDAMNAVTAHQVAQPDGWDEAMIKIFGEQDLDKDTLSDCEDMLDDTGLPDLPSALASNSNGQPQAPKPALTKNQRRNQRRSPQKKLKKELRDVGREAEVLVKKAKMNLVTFASFNFAEACCSPKKYAETRDPPAEPLREWTDGVHRVAMSSDNVPILVHLPEGLRPDAQRKLFQVIQQYGLAIGPKVKPTSADKHGRDQAASYIHRDGEIVGIVKLVTDWHPIGHCHEPQVASRDLLASGRRFCLAMEFKNKLYLLTHRVNSLLRHIDPFQYQALQNLRKAVHDKYVFARAIDSIDPLLFEGRAIMWNRQTRLHADTTDPVRAWVALVVLGTFRKGEFFIPRLNLRISYEPGTIVYIRGHILPHEVEAWEGGQRVSMVHFTHQSVWDEFNMTCL